MIDVSKYNDGLRGGVVKIRAKIEKDAGNKILRITEIPIRADDFGFDRFDSEGER